MRAFWRKPGLLLVLLHEAVHVAPFTPGWCFTEGMGPRECCTPASQECWTDLWAGMFDRCCASSGVSCFRDGFTPERCCEDLRADASEEEPAPPRHLELQSTMTYASAKAACQSSGRRLCYASEICQGTTLKIMSGDPLRGDHWVPVQNSFNDWVEIGDSFDRTCWSHNGPLLPDLSMTGNYAAPAWGTSSSSAAHKGNVFCCELTQDDKHACWTGSWTNMEEACCPPPGSKYCPLGASLFDVDWHGSISLCLDPDVHGDIFVYQHSKYPECDAIFSLVDVFMKHLDSLKLPFKGCEARARDFWDVGASTGICSTFAARNGWNVTAIEPVLSAVEQMRASLKANGLGARLLQLAVSDRPGEAVIAVPPLGWWRQATLLGSPLAEYYSGEANYDWQIHKGEKMKVETARLDSLEKGTTLGSPAFIKLETMGMEAMALEGARGLFAADSMPYVVVLRWFPAASGMAPLEFLRAQGFRLFLVRGQPMSLWNSSGHLQVYDVSEFPPDVEKLTEWQWDHSFVLAVKQSCMEPWRRSTSELLGVAQCDGWNLGVFC